MPTCYWLPITKYMYSSCGTFLYRKRLLQQNGDMRKRHLHACKLHLEQGHIYSHLSPPHPPLTDAIREAGWLCFLPPPPLPTHSPCWIYVIFSILGQKRGWPLFRCSKVLQLNSDSFCDYVRIWSAVIGHLEAEIGFWFFPQEMVKIYAPAYIWTERRYFGKSCRYNSRYSTGETPPI